MKQRLLYIILVVSFFPFGAYSQDSAIHGGQLYSSDFDIDGISRNVTFYIPVNYGRKDTYPLVLLLHNTGESSSAIIKMYGGIAAVNADSDNCIVLYPDAVNSKWNDMMQPNSTNTVNDVGFLTIMIDYFIQQYHCDKDRVYIIGISDGGKMAYRLACNIPSKIAAIAPFMLPVKGTTQTCEVPASVPVMDTGKYLNPDIKKIGNNAIGEAFHFFMMHSK